MLLKRIFDLFSAVAGLILLSPLFLLIAVLIRIKMPGPVIFTQKRIGQNGKVFTIYKFRTMVSDHEGNTISVKGENRIPPFGAFLRRSKLDELPELWNVIKGEMALVGPRPDVPGYADELQGDDRVILQVKPGLTGPACMKYSHEEELLARQEDPLKYNDQVLYPDKVQINKSYIHHWSFGLDLKIILYTLLNKKLPEKWAQ